MKLEITLAILALNEGKKTQTILQDKGLREKVPLTPETPAQHVYGDAVQRQTAVTGYFISEQLPLFALARQREGHQVHWPGTCQSTTRYLHQTS